MKIKKDRIYLEEISVDVYYSMETDFSKDKQGIIILPGFPDLLGPTKMTYLQMELRNIVFQPHLKGTYDSRGCFSPEGIKETLITLDKLMIEAKASFEPKGHLEKMPWNIESIILCGHSFSGIIVLRYFDLLTNLKKIIITSPALHYGKGYGSKIVGPQYYLSIQKKYPYTYRLAPVSKWVGVLEGRDEIPKSQKGRVESVDVFYGCDDTYFDIEEVEQNTINLIKSYIGADVYTLHMIENVGHSLNEILSNEMVRDYLKVVCKNNS